MAWVAGVTDDPLGFPHALPGVDVLEGGKLTSYNVAAVRATLCRALRLLLVQFPYQTVMQPVRMLSTVQV